MSEPEGDLKDFFTEIFESYNAKNSSEVSIIGLRFLVDKLGNIFLKLT